jgi:integrase
MLQRGMQIKPNVLTIKAKLKERGTFSIAGHPGLHLASRGDGTGSWRIKYRPHGSTHQKWFTVSNDAKNATFDAIVEAKDKWLVQVKHEKVDPKVQLEVEAKTKAAAEKAVASTYNICFLAWLENPGRKRVLSKRTREEYEGLHKRHVSPLIGETPVSSLTRADLDKALRSIFDATNDPANGQRGLQATKAYQNIRSVLEWCVDAEHLTANPMRMPSWLPAKDNPKGKQSRPPTDAELRQLWTEGPNVMSPAQWRVMRLAILLGRRVSEIAGAARTDLRLEADPPYMVIPAEREGNKAKSDDAVPLPRAAVAIIREALAVGSVSDPLFVGAATRWTTSKALTDARRDWGWPGQVRLHDARTLINDHMARLGIPTEIRSRTLHHTGDLRQLANTVYSSFDHMPERMRALRLWALRLRNIVSERRLHTLRWIA